MGTTAIGTAGFALCELLIAPLRSTPVIALLLFIGGICFTTWSSNSNSLIQLAAPDYLRGRLIGLYFFAFAGTGTAGGILSGWLAAAGRNGACLRGRGHRRPLGLGLRLAALARGLAGRRAARAS